MHAYRSPYSPHSDVKDVASDRAGHGHVPQPLPGHYDTGDKIRDRGPSSQDGQTHDLFTNADSLSNRDIRARTTVRAETAEPNTIM